MAGKPEPALASITFGNAQIARFTRVSTELGWIKWRCLISKGYEKVFSEMGWELPSARTRIQDLDGSLEGGYFVLTPSRAALSLRSQDRTVDTDAEVNIEYVAMTSFKCCRVPNEDPSKPGTRLELRFISTFKCADGAANLEAYMTRTGNARGSLRVAYLRPPEQVVIPDIEATNEQRQAVLEMEGE